MTKKTAPVIFLGKVFQMVNYLFMCLGQLFEVLAFVASLPATVLSSIAQYFYFAGTNFNNFGNNEDE